MFEKLPIKQVLKMIKSHMIASICIFILEMLMVSVVHGTNVGSYIFSVFAILVYFVVIYSDSYDLAKRDKKSYTKEEPYFTKGFFLAWGIVVLTAILYVIYAVVWNAYIKTIPGFLLNLIFRIWISPFRNFVGLSEAYMMWYGYIAIFVIPVIMSGVGYIAGLKDFDMHSKISKFVYENKEEKKDNGQNK